MSIEILSEHQSATAAVPWRSVTRRAENAGERAEVDVAVRLQQARQDGFANGLATAHQEGENSLIPAIQKLADSVAQVARLRDAIREQSTEDVVRMALAIASRILYRNVALDSLVLAGLLKAAFSKLRSEEISVVHVHPGLEPTLRKCLERSGVPSNLYVLTDSKLPPGKSTFETDASCDPAVGLAPNVDLSEIDRGLTDRLGK